MRVEVWDGMAVYMCMCMGVDGIGNWAWSSKTILGKSGKIYSDVRRVRDRGIVQDSKEVVSVRRDSCLTVSAWVRFQKRSWI